MAFSIINHPAIGVPAFMETPIWIVKHDGVLSISQDEEDAGPQSYKQKQESTESCNAVHPAGHQASYMRNIPCGKHTKNYGKIHHAING